MAMKRINGTTIYKASNVTFNSETCEAHSYVWWRFVARVEGKVVFDNYPYSPTTVRHQHKVRRLMSELGVKIDIEMPLPGGIGGASLEQMIVWGEETLCNKYLEQQLKNQERYERRKAAKAEYNSQVVPL